MPGRFKRLWLVFIAVLAVQIYLAYFEETEGPGFRRPPPELYQPPPAAPPGDPLPGRSRFDPVFTVKTGEKQNSLGTAFAIRDDGVWLTARHVVDGCDRVGLMTGPRRGIRVRHTEVHPEADIAVLRTRGGPPGFAISREPLRANQLAFHIGFPEGKPGQVVSALIGRRNMRTVGRYSMVEPVVAWVERIRVPETETLGGLSGGPAINARGEVVGVTVAASQRRGRVFTTAPVTLEAMLARAAVTPAGAPSAGLRIDGPTETTFTRYGSELRDRLSVSKVVCLVDRPDRRPGVS